MLNKILQSYGMLFNYANQILSVNTEPDVTPLGGNISFKASSQGGYI